MILFRRARADDLAGIYQLAKGCGTGITTLPADKEVLGKRLAWSCESFERTMNQLEHEYYLFVLEDSKSKQIIGTSAIESPTGFDVPFYSYKITKKTRVCTSLNIRSDYEVLSLVNDYQGNSEMCTLFLNPDWRYNNNGLLLSRARFLFMSLFHQRFRPVVFAEMRGVSDESGRSPFWEHVGKYFFHMSFTEADRLTLTSNKQFIADLMPRNPIYVKLLNQEAQDVIGKTHPSTRAALKILFQEGFRFNNYIDIFDAGPTIEAPLEEIRTVRNSQTVCIKNISDEVGSAPCLISNTQMDFRATMGEAIVDRNNKTCIISKATAALLQVKKGEQLRLTLLSAANTSKESKT